MRLQLPPEATTSWIDQERNENLERVSMDHKTMSSGAISVRSTSSKALEKHNEPSQSWAKPNRDDDVTRVLHCCQTDRTGPDRILVITRINMWKLYTVGRSVQQRLSLSTNKEEDSLVKIAGFSSSWEIEGSVQECATWVQQSPSPSTTYFYFVLFQSAPEL